MANWIEYTGSAAQIEALALAKTMVRVRYANRQEVNWSCTLFRSESNARDILRDAVAYLICEPHPHADIIKIWADTGCEVYVREHHNNYYEGILESTDCFYHSPTNKPNWNIPNAEYRLTPFED